MIEKFSVIMIITASCPHIIMSHQRRLSHNFSFRRNNQCILKILSNKRNSQLSMAETCVLIPKSELQSASIEILSVRAMINSTKVIIIELYT
jgi:hypothetical protein